MQTVLVLGANGHLGTAAVHAFAQAGWRVLALARQAMPFAGVQNVTCLQCDALDTDQVLHLAGKVDVIVNGLSPNYAKWDTLLPPMTAAVIRLAQASHALLMIPGNVYNFGRELPAVLTENTPFVANTTKGAQRIAMEHSIATANGVQTVVIRAGDFLGSNGTWLDLAIGKSLHNNIVTQMGPSDLPHAWAYLPDLAQVFVRVAAQREQLGKFTQLHYEGITATGAQMQQALQEVTGRPLQAKAMAWWLWRGLALFVPVLREVIKMRYLWQRPHRLDGSKLKALLGQVPGRSLQQALAETLQAQPASLEQLAGFK